MDKNQVTGLVLIAALLIAYAVFFKPPAEELTEPINTEQSTQPQQQAPTEIKEANVGQALGTPELQQQTNSDFDAQYGVFANGAQGEEKQIIIENEKARFSFNTKGGNIQSVELKEYLTYDKKPLNLFDKENNQQSISFQTANGKIDLSQLYYTTNARSKTVTIGDTTTLTFSLQTTDNNSVEHIYKVPGDGFQVFYELRINGLKNTIVSDLATLSWVHRMKRLELNLDDSRNKNTVRWYTVSEDSDNLKAISKDALQEQVPEGLKWASFNQKFFNIGIIADRGFSGGLFNSDIPLNDTTIVKNTAMNLSIPMTDLYAGGKFSYYFGPNKYKVLKKIAPSYEDNLYLGYTMVSWVNKYILIELMAVLEKFVPSYGVIIIIMVFLIKLVLFPLTRKSYLSMAKMKAMKPELDELKEKIGDDPQKMQQEQMKLYRQVGVNPLSGCIPMVLQMPILFAMFFFFPNAIELRGESFLWATDLSTFDVLFQLPFTIPFYGSHVSGFTLLMTMSSILYTWSNNQVSTVQGPMKTIGYVMPVIFMFVLNSYASGLSFYYFLSNIVTFGQQALIRKFVDEDKIKATLEENKKNNVNKKKSKFQQRLDDAMKASKEAQKKKEQQKKKR